MAAVLLSPTIIYTFQHSQIDIIVLGGCFAACGIVPANRAEQAMGRAGIALLLGYRVKDGGLLIAASPFLMSYEATSSLIG